MRLFTLILLLISFEIKAQVCSGPGRTPQTATVVCGTLVFTESNLTNCTAPNLPGMGCGNTVTSGRSVWYRFRCYQSGTLGFTIAPLSFTDDYDWELMDITNRAPQDVLTVNLGISINLSGDFGSTGCNAAGSGSMNCGGNGIPLFNSMPNLIAGHDYLLMVTNWSNSGLGYNLLFTGGTAVLTDNQLPTVSNVGPVGCNSSQIKVQLSEDILCSSLTAAGSEFTITDGTNTYPFASIASQCSSGLNAITEFTLNMQNPLPPGNYDLVVNPGTDANTLLDVCLTEMVAGSSFPFTIVAQPALAVDDITYAGCAPTILKVALNKLVLCNSITASGSEFSITPGNPAIASVQTLCSGTVTRTDTIQIVLQNPLPHGNYQLVVNNGTDANTLIDTCNLPLPAGYQFPFIIAQITTAPVMQSIGFDECKPFRVVVNFDKPVACNSISPTGSEFSITPGTLTVTGINTVCSAGGTTSQVVLTLSGNLPAGNFNVNINNGSDANTISDSCFAFMPAASARPFTTTQSPAPVYDSVQYDKCSPSFIRVFYSNPIFCNSINQDASEFSITGPEPVTISSVNTDATCSNGYTNWIVLNLAQPINTFGNFVLHNIAGTDGNSVTDTCYAAQNITETISFNVLGKPSAVFEDSVHFGCVTDTLVVSHPGGNGINSWQWTFSDGTVLTGPSVFHEFPVSTVTASVRLVVSNGICSDTLSRSYTLNNAFAAGFSISADTLCRNKDLSFTNTSTGNNLTYNWNFGDGNTFTEQTPPPHSYANPGNYTITLTVNNDHACMDDSIKIVNVTDTPLVRFTGLNSQYCTGETVTVATNITGGNVAGYTWNNGNGVTNSNQSPVNYTYSTEGNYTITLTATDRFCGDFSFNQATQIYKVPTFSLKEDITLCPGMTTEIGVEPTPGYTYLWNTGATSSKIITGPVSATYELTIDNHTCTASDEIFIEVLDNCLIKVPGAFTPNNDGRNDLLKAINADLAKEFQLRVYNRFGQMMFATRVPTDGWDGRLKGVPADTGTYVWQLSYIHPVTGLHVYEKGTSILIR